MRGGLRWAAGAGGELDPRNTLPVTRLWAAGAGGVLAEERTARDAIVTPVTRLWEAGTRGAGSEERDNRDVRVTPVSRAYVSGGRLVREVLVPKKTHGAVYADGWFEGIHWSPDEARLAYVAEEPQPDPTPLWCADGEVNGTENPATGGWRGQ
eukprot:1195134-Prorocentrum_minimum.AAC.1